VLVAPLDGVGAHFLEGGTQLGDLLVVEGSARQHHAESLVDAVEAGQLAGKVQGDGLIDGLPLQPFLAGERGGERLVDVGRGVGLADVGIGADATPRSRSAAAVMAVTMTTGSGFVSRSIFSASQIL